MRYLSARQMIFDAYQSQRGSVMASAAEVARLGARVQTTKRNNNDWRIVHGLEAGAVISAVESQPAHLQALARYCFGPFTREELAADQEWLQGALVRSMMESKLPGQGKSDRPPVESWRTFTALAWAAIYHHGETTYPYSRTGLSGPRLIKRWVEDERGQTIDVRRWGASGRVSWDSVWKQLLMILDDWEREVLGSVSALIPSAA